MTGRTASSSRLAVVLAALALTGLLTGSAARATRRPEPPAASSHLVATVRYAGPAAADQVALDVSVYNRGTATARLDRVSVLPTSAGDERVDQPGVDLAAVDLAGGSAVELTTTARLGCRAGLADRFTVRVAARVDDQPTELVATPTGPFEEICRRRVTAWDARATVGSTRRVGDRLRLELTGLPPGLVVGLWVEGFGPVALPATPVGPDRRARVDLMGLGIGDCSVPSVLPATASLQVQDRRRTCRSPSR
jgi:hypothetical protein